MKYAGIIIEDCRGRYLIQLRDNKPGIINPNKLGTFGGGIENNELPKNGAIRELKEELGLQVEPGKIKLFLKILLPWYRIYLYKFDLIEGFHEPILKEGIAMKYYTRREILRKKNLVRSLKVVFWLYPFFLGIHRIKDRIVKALP